MSRRIASTTKLNSNGKMTSPCQTHRCRSVLAGCIPDAAPERRTRVRNSYCVPHATPIPVQRSGKNPRHLPRALPLRQAPQRSSLPATDPDPEPARRQQLHPIPLEQWRPVQRPVQQQRLRRRQRQRQRRRMIQRCQQFRTGPVTGRPGPGQPTPKLWVQRPGRIHRQRQDDLHDFFCAGAATVAPIASDSMPTS